MTAPNLFDPPPKYVLPLAKGQDLSVDFRNNPSGDTTMFVDYDDGVTVTLTIDTDPPTVAPAMIDGYHAYVKIESTVTDSIITGIGWRLIVSTPTDPSTETVAANGKTKRFDGT